MAAFCVFKNSPRSGEQIVDFEYLRTTETILLWLLGSCCGTFVLGIAAVFVYGMFLPAAHSVTCRLHLKKPIEEVWAAISADEQPWRKDLIARERAPDQDGKPVWIESSGRFRIPLRYDEVEPHSTLVSTVADPKIPFQGRWIYRLERVDGGTAITLTEEGIISNPFMRAAMAMAKNTSTLTAYLSYLAAHFGEPAAIETVR